MVHFVIINNTQDANMIIDLRKEPKEVREWVQDAERATGLSGFALIMGAIMDFSNKAKKNRRLRKNPAPKKNNNVSQRKMTK